MFGVTGNPDAWVCDTSRSAKRNSASQFEEIFLRKDTRNDLYSRGHALSAHLDAPLSQQTC